MTDTPYPVTPNDVAMIRQLADAKQVEPLMQMASRLQSMVEAYDAANPPICRHCGKPIAIHDDHLWWPDNVCWQCVGHADWRTPHWQSWVRDGLAKIIDLAAELASPAPDQESIDIMYYYLDEMADAVEANA